MKKFHVVMAMLCLGLLPACSKNSALTLPAPTLTSIQITLSTPSVPAGLSDQLTATGEYSNNGSPQNLTASVTWTSSDTSVATVSTAGVVTTFAQGTAKITGTLSGVSSSPLTLTVSAPIVTKLAVSSTSASIARGTTVQFTATGTLTDGTTENATDLVTWTSSNPSTVSINVNGAQGLAMGLTSGTSTVTATITTTSGTVSQSATLTVTNATLTSISVTPINALIPLGTVQQFTATGTFSDNSTQDTTGTVVWSTSPTSVASITVSGLVTAKDIGNFTVTATSGTVSQGVSATVNAADLSSIAVLPANPTIAQNTSEQFSAIGTFDDGSTHNLTGEVTWSSSNSGAATIGASGLAKGLSRAATATTNITATLGTVSGFTTLTVTNATISSISISPAGRTIAPGTQLQFTATGTFSDGSTQVLNRDATWASDNTAVAIAEGVGTVTAVAPGTANISATFGGVPGSVLLTVSSVTLTSIAVSPSTAAIAPGSTLGYSATGTFSDGSTQRVTSTVTWSSSSTSVATITTAGQVTGESEGTTTITAQQGSVSGTAALVVGSSTLNSVQVTPATATVAELTGTQFQAIGIFEDNSTQILTNSVTWTSSPVSVATVSDGSSTKGLATGVAPGTATITALFAGLTGQASLAVTNATLTSITLTPGTATIALDGSQQFSATGNFSDGTTENLTAQATWKSSDAGVASVSADGLASPSGAGTTTITATMNGMSGTASLTVN
jgi:uncharacterized protein YjdB